MGHIKTISDKVPAASTTNILKIFIVITYKLMINNYQKYWKI